MASASPSPRDAPVTIATLMATTLPSGAEDRSCRVNITRISLLYFGRAWISLGRRGSGEGSTGQSGSSAQPRERSTARSQTSWKASVSSTGSWGSNTASASHRPASSSRRRPDTLGQAGDGGRAERGRLGGAGTGHRHAALLGLELEEEVHGGGAPVHPQRGAVGRRRTRAAMASVMSRTWKAIASTQARASWARPAPRVSPVTMPRA